MEIKKNLTVSVIIPTYHRPAYLKETIQSVWEQTVLPDEIIIGDDSKDDETEKMVNAELIPNSPVPIRYFHHQPSLKEVKNVDFQYAAATGDLVLHLHDDDPIYPKCLELLKAPLEKHPEAIASFGLQHIIDENGDKTADNGKFNSIYFRTPDREGLTDGFTAGAVSMFPNNGFMVRRDEVLKIGYSDKGVAGMATDFYFGYRLGKLNKPFFFVNEYTAKIRLTANSQSRTSTADNAYRAVKILLEECPKESINDQIRQSLSNRMPIAIDIATAKKEKSTAIKWFLSPYFRSKIFTPKGLKRMWGILRS